jgi:hypothetical protein
MDPLKRYGALKLAQRFSERLRGGDDCTTCPTTLTAPDGVVVTDKPIAAAATTVAQAVVFPADHFQKWQSRGKDMQPLTFHPDGRITGHIAGQGCFRNGDMTRCQRYQPDPDPKLSNFHSWTTTLDNGEVIRTGVLTAGGKHADLYAGMTASDVRRIHEDTSTVVARVRAWEDGSGRLAVAGSIVPTIDPGFLSQAAGAPVSIEQIPTFETNGRNTLVSAHMVVHPAWPVLETAS